MEGMRRATSKLATSEALVLTDMPDLVVLTIVEFMGPEDTAKLSMTCRRLYDLLPKFLVMKGADFSIRGTGTGWGGVEPYFDGPVLQTAVKSLKVSVAGWKDQGWGNRKGIIFVRLMRRPVEPASSGGGTREESTIVAEERDLFGLAEHMETSAERQLKESDTVVSLARPGDWYQFMRRGGGGGGHRLDVRGFRAVATLRIQ